MTLIKKMEGLITAEGAETTKRLEMQNRDKT